MPINIGTRTVATLRKERIDAGSDTRSHSADKGMTKRVSTTATFTTDGKITGSNGDFTSFVVGDPVLVDNVNLNNGYFTITAIDGTNHAFITVDPPPKAEGPIATIIRTA